MRRRLTALALLGVTSSAFAVFPDYGADTTYNSVGQFGGASAVAIDSRWVLTAQHVNGSTFTLNGVDYNVVENHEPGIVNGVRPDLRLLKVDKDIPTFTRIDLRAPVGGMVTMVGFGESGTEISGGYSIPGGMGGTRRAANNIIDGLEDISFESNPPYEPYWTTMYYTLSAPGDSTRVSNEGGIASGDSGGGWFTDFGNGPVLVATSSAIDSPTHDNTTSPYAYGGFGYGTWLGSADSAAFLRQYVPQAVVPEPATFAALGVGALTLLRRRRPRG